MATIRGEAVFDRPVEEVFDRPVEEVFDFLADPRDEPLYNPLIVRAEKTTGPVRVGARFVQRAKTVGGRAGRPRPHRPLPGFCAAVLHTGAISIGPAGAAGRRR